MTWQNRVTPTCIENSGGAEGPKVPNSKNETEAEDIPSHPGKAYALTVLRGIIARYR